MKKQIISWGMMLVAAFTLTNCAKEIENPNQQPEQQGYPFEIVASTVDTKTVNEGMATKWAEGDKINLFHAVTGGEDYINDANETLGAFTFTSDDIFKGQLAESLTSGSYDWYALYPYSKFTTTPSKSGYLPIGCEPAKSTNQVQVGNSNMKHISGPNYPLWGNVTAIAHDERPSIPMSHVASLIKVVVENTTEEPLTVESVAFTAPVDVVGTYYITFNGDVVSCENSGEQYVSKTATLNVNESEEIPAGKSADFYLAVRPFTAEAGTSLSLAVNGYAKEPKILESDVTFHAGKIKTLNFVYDKVTASEPDDEDFSGEWLITGTDSGKLYVATAADNGNGNNLKSTLQIAINDNKITEVDGLSDCKMTIAKITDGGTYDGMYTIKDAKGKYLYAAGSDKNYLRGSATLSVDSYWDITLKDNGVYEIVATKSSNRNKMQFNYNSGSPLVSCYSSSTTSMTPITLYSYSMVVPDLTPRIVVTETVKSSVPAEGGEVTFTYELRNLEGKDVNVTVSNSEMLAAVAANGIVTVTVTKNEGDERKATITLSCGEAENIVLTVEQLAAPATGGDIVAGNEYTYTFTSKQWSANGSKTLNGLSWILAGDGDYWGYDATKGQQFGSGNAPYKSMTLSTSGYEGGVTQIVVNTSGASSIAGNLVITVGGVQYGSKITLTKTATSYTFNAPAEGMQAGDIVLTYTQTSSKAIYIKSITIN